MDHVLLSSFFDLLFDSEKIIMTGGIALIVLIVYLENGVLIAFFLPGDYLLTAYPLRSFSFFIISFNVLGDVATAC